MCSKRFATAIGIIALIVIGAFASTIAVSFAEKSSTVTKATFAGGCFWCMEEAFEKVPGVVSVRSGYTDGRVLNPSYKAVSAGGTGHTEAIEVIFDPATIPYQQLLKVFWRNIDPTIQDRQFCDPGTQYRPSIFYHDDTQRELAEKSKLRTMQSKTFAAPIVTPIVKASTFYPAEEYHQDYYTKNPVRYKFYKWNCGRAQRLAELWGESY